MFNPVGQANLSVALMLAIARLLTYLFQLPILLPLLICLLQTDFNSRKFANISINYREYSITVEKNTQLYIDQRRVDGVYLNSLRRYNFTDISKTAYYVSLAHLDNNFINNTDIFHNLFQC